VRKLLLAAAVVGALALAAAARPKPAPADVIGLLERNYASIHDYSADIEVSVDSPQLHMPRSAATLYFKRPDRMKIVPKEGFAVLPKDVFPGDPVRSIKQNFRLERLDSAKVGNEPVYVLSLVPKTTDVRGAMKLFVEKRRGIIIGTDADVGGAKFKSRWTYARVEGKYWLPSEIRIEMSGAMSTPVFDPREVKIKPPKSGKGTTLVRFSDYKINRGIPDSVFAEGKQTSR